VINPVREPLDYHFGGTVVDLARVDFAVNAGDISWETYSGPASLTDIHYVWPSTSMASGMSFVRSEVKQSNVLDGASQVIYCGEKWAPRGEQYLGNGFNQPLTAGENRDLHRFTVGPPVGDGDSQLGSISHFGSSHANGCNFVFVDGATHVISYSIHPAVFSKLGNKGDGQSLDLGGIVE
jgi:prepilin-type processing-associated H-X9-DG protein